MLKIEYCAGFFNGEGSIGIYKNGRGSWHVRTQVTQNVNKFSTSLLSELKDAYGGNLAIMRSSIYRNDSAYNWQLNSKSAIKFLKILYPHLLLKNDQAFFAISWYEISQKQQRGKDGRIIPHDKNRKIDIEASEILKLLKKDDLEVVLQKYPFLIDTASYLKNVVWSI